MERARIVIISQDTELRATMRSQLESSALCKVVGEACNGHQGIARATELQPGLALIDSDLPGLSGHAVAAILLRGVPELRVINLVPVADFDHLYASARCGGATAIRGDADAASVIESVEAVLTQPYRFHPWPIPAVGSAYADGYDPREGAIDRVLTVGQAALLDCWLMGLNTKEVTEALGETSYGVRKESIGLFTALGAQQKVGAIATALERGWSTIGRRKPIVTVALSAGGHPVRTEWVPHLLDGDVVSQQAEFAI
jgi:two-component system nitrate/nitrite response regulator NarL